jgi:hypothetical protein
MPPPTAIGPPVVGSGPEWSETQRTPGPAAGCNKPATSERRKPSRWCETTRTEQDLQRWSLWSRSRRQRLHVAPSLTRSACGSGRSVAVTHRFGDGVGGGGRGARLGSRRKPGYRASTDESHERRSAEVRPGQQVRALKGSQGPEGPHESQPPRGGDGSARCRRKTSKASAVTRNAREGAGK